LALVAQALETQAPIIKSVFLLDLPILPPLRACTEPSISDQLLTTMSKKIIILLFTVLLLVAAGIFGYQQLGGFKPVAVQLSDEPAFFIAGKYYEGEIRSAGLNDLLSELEERYRAGEMDGVFTICYFDNPDEKTRMKVLAGVSLPDTTGLPTDFEAYRVTGGSMAKAVMTSHVLVAPSSSSTNEKLLSLAQKEGLQPVGPFVEQYFHERKVVTLIPLQPR